jgi:hypothetical protein
MNYAVKKIRGKKPSEIYTPSGANKGGHDDRDAFENVVGNTDFHSFQVWRNKADGKPTLVYAMTLEQIQAISIRKRRELGGLKGRVTKLLREIQSLQSLATEAEMLEAENKKLLAMKVKARQIIDEYKAKEEARKPKPPKFIIGGQSQGPLTGTRSLTGKGASQLCAEAVGTTDEFRGTVRG